LSITAKGVYRWTNQAKTQNDDSMITPNPPMTLSLASGFAVVPVEPTEAMIEAGELASLQSSVRGSKVAHIYSAMCRAKDE
jgi:hypothetical protein